LSILITEDDQVLADGSGLDLAIVREVVDRHGGVISIEDARARAPGVSHPGTRFSLRFNAAPQA